jgi:hypothetical protein
MSKELISSATLAEIVFNKTLVNITQGEDAGEVTPQDCLEAITGPDGDKLAGELYDCFAIVGMSAIVKTFKEAGVEFSGEAHNRKDFKEELTQLWEIFTILPEDAQQAHAQSLVAWVAGEGEYPQIG